MTATLSGGTLVTVNDASSTTNNIGATSTFNVNSGGRRWRTATASRLQGLGGAAVNLNGGTLAVSNTAPLRRPERLKIVNSGTIQVNGSASLANNIAFANNAGVTIAGGPLAVTGGSVALTGADVPYPVNNTTTVNDTIGGAALRAGGVERRRPGAQRRSADSYTGVTNIAGGILRPVSNPGALSGSAASIANGASLQLAGGFSEAEPIAALAVGGTIESLNGSNTLTGAITLTGSVNSGQCQFRGRSRRPVDGERHHRRRRRQQWPGHRQRGAGTLVLAPTANNTFTGGTTLNAGVLTIGNTNQAIGTGAPDARRGHAYFQCADPAAGGESPCGFRRQRQRHLRRQQRHHVFQPDCHSVIGDRRAGLDGHDNRRHESADRLPRQGELDRDRPLDGGGDRRAGASWPPTPLPASTRPSTAAR